MAVSYTHLPDRLIEEMSHYLAASGKAYQNYAAALHRWAANDKKGAVKQDVYKRQEYGLYYSPVSTPADFRSLAPIVLELSLIHI